MALTDKKRMQKGQKGSQINTETMLPISEIRGDTLLLKDGWLRWILRVSGLNIDLKNGDEQQAVVEQYKKFLNGLGYPIQILIRNTYLDLTDYVEYLQVNVDAIENETLKNQGNTFISFMEDINLQQGLIYVKEFYVIVPFYPADDDKNIRKPWYRKFMDALMGKQTPEMIVRNRRRFVDNAKQLETRCTIINEWLRDIGMDVERLDTEDITQLLFKYYNPVAHENMAPLN